MAGSSLFALIDDIATILDDVAVLSKVAMKKTAGVLGDDLALNAEQVSGVQPDRELPVVWAVAKGSFLNKCILVPAALIISWIAPWAITPLLMIGGLFLCFEGSEKVAHLFQKETKEDKEDHQELLAAIAEGSDDLLKYEEDKIKGAIRTDFILSAEIIVISLGTLGDTDFLQRVLVLSTIAIVMTIGVYGLVAGIVKLDDAGLHLTQAKDSPFKQSLGRAILMVAPKIMVGLSWAGMIAMFLVGGGILAHGIPPVHHGIEHIGETGGVIGAFAPTLLNGLVGLAAGFIVLGAVVVVQKIRGK